MSDILQARVPASQYGCRLDQTLAELFPDHSRSRLQQWIAEGRVRIDGEVTRVKKARLLGGEKLEVEPSTEPLVELRPQPIALELLHEDAELLIVNKPAGLVVHPAVGNPDGTLVNALLHHDPRLAELPRAGIVHRLDKDTSGILVVARSNRAHRLLVEQLQAREFVREYLALVEGHITAGGSINQPLDRHPTQRTRRAVVAGGKPAITHYRVLERFTTQTLLQVRLETGRTHQIRVHMAWLHHPLVGDPVYGGRLRMPQGASPALRAALTGFRRQALHAQRLGLIHPARHEYLEWQVDPPEDLQALLTQLRNEPDPA